MWTRLLVALARRERVEPESLLSLAFLFLLVALLCGNHAFFSVALSRRSKSGS